MSQSMCCLFNYHNSFSIVLRLCVAITNGHSLFWWNSGLHTKKNKIFPLPDSSLSPQQAS